MSVSNNKIISNFFWRFAERIGAQAVQLIVSLVLARILVPEDYGIIALITVFISLLQVMIDNGLGNALIQKKNADDLDFSTVFYANIVFCFGLYVIVFLCSPLISAFYNNPSLTLITRVLGVTILISGVKNIQQAYVARNLIFKRFFFATLGGTLSAAVVGIILALNGAGVWALVAQQLLNISIDTLILWLTVKWRPKKIFSFERLKTLFSYGWKLLVSAFIDKGHNNLQQLLIGKIYTSDSLAFYNQGKQFPEVIVNNVNTSIDSVIFPTMSQEQEDRNEVMKMARKTLKTSIFIMAPIMIGLAFTARNLVEILLTEKWLPCVPFLIVFSISYMFWPIHTANLNAIKAMGRSDLFLILEIAKKGIGIIILLITLQISPLAMAIGILISDLISQIINAIPNKKLIGYGYFQQVKDIAPYIVLALIMGIIISFYNLLPLHIILRLAAQIITGMVFYVVGAKIFKFEPFLHIMQIINTTIKKKHH